MKYPLFAIAAIFDARCCELTTRLNMSSSPLILHGLKATPR